jgi:rod shape-determining protein MreC
VAPGYPVVGAGGLVGQVIQSFHHTCVVRLITDGQSKVGVVFGPANRYTAIVDGQGPGSDLTADLVAPGTPLHKGQQMWTSGLQAATFPPGIPVATVSSFHTPSGASQISIAVDPSANLNQLAYVDVVQWVPNT